MGIKLHRGFESRPLRFVFGPPNAGLLTRTLGSACAGCCLRLSGRQDLVRAHLSRSRRGVAAAGRALAGFGETLGESRPHGVVVDGGPHEFVCAEVAGSGFRPAPPVCHACGNEVGRPPPKRGSPPTLIIEQLRGASTLLRPRPRLDRPLSMQFYQEEGHTCPAFS
jgi:hypothetical protein